MKAWFIGTMRLWYPATSIERKVSSIRLTNMLLKPSRKEMRRSRSMNYDTGLRLVEMVMTAIESSSSPTGLWKNTETDGEQYFVFLLPIGSNKYKNHNESKYTNSLRCPFHVT